MLADLDAAAGMCAAAGGARQKRCAEEGIDALFHQHRNLDQHDLPGLSLSQPVTAWKRARQGEGRTAAAGCRGVWAPFSQAFGVDPFGDASQHTRKRARHDNEQPALIAPGFAATGLAAAQQRPHAAFEVRKRSRQDAAASTGVEDVVFDQEEQPLRPEPSPASSSSGRELVVFSPQVLPGLTVLEALSRHGPASNLPAEVVREIEALNRLRHGCHAIVPYTGPPQLRTPPVAVEGLLPLLSGERGGDSDEDGDDDVEDTWIREVPSDGDDMDCV